MKKIILIGLIGLIGCQSYDAYYEQYQYSETPFNDAINYCIDSPLVMLDNMLNAILAIDYLYITLKHKQNGTNI